MANDAVPAEDFDRVATLHCKRWEARSLKVARALLVEGKRVTDVAEEFGMKSQQAIVLRTRFLERMRQKAVVKVPAETFMQSVTPSNTSVLEPFRNDLKQLTMHGYSEAQLVEFLRTNDVEVSQEELSTFLGVVNVKTISTPVNENPGPGKPKRRRR
jgi:hypothetical protein